jgi:hypothetical protein
MHNEVNEQYSLGGVNVGSDGSDCEVNRWDGLRWHHIHTKSHDDQFKHSSNVKGITSTIWEAIVLVLLMRGIYDVRHWDAVEMASCVIIYILCFMKTGTGVQAILGFCLRNLRGCNAGITDGRDL